MAVIDRLRGDPYNLSMVRAPGSGAPQRVSAHVVPKAPAFPPATSSDAPAEEEKTAIESGWEDEPSTTVEQGDVAEKIRTLAGAPASRGLSSITSTNNSVLDEPTVDDQRAHAAIAAIAPPVAAPARLVVTQGNDTGQHLEVAPGKSYTIGRAIDNDFVLTDIAVSRKHFDLRLENGGWVIADRGSGNGTLVNGNLEDQPFVLANGDVIEIGNTAFRFDHASAPARPRPVAGRYDIASDEEEQSTVAGKPIRNEETATPAQMPPPPRVRPKTVPPPAPVPRTRNPAQSTAPPNGAAMNGARGMGPAAGGLPGLPPQLARPAMAGEPPRPAPQLPLPSALPQASQPQPQILSLAPQQARSQPQALPQPQPGLRPPQAGPAPVSARPMAPMAQRPPRPSPQNGPMGSMGPQVPMGPQSSMGPQASMGSMGPQSSMNPMGSMGSMGPMGPMGPQSSMGPQPSMGPQAPTMLAADAMGARPTGLPTTIPGQGPPPPMHPQLPYSYPSVADIQKHAHMLVVGNGAPRDATSTALVQPTPFGVVPTVSSTPVIAPPAISRKTKLLLGGAALTLLAAIATIAIMKGTESTGKEEPAGDGSAEIDSDEPEATKPEATKPEATKPEATKPETAKPETAKPETAKIAQPEATKPETTDTAKPETTKPETTDTAKPETTKPETTKPETTKPETTKNTKDSKDSKKPPKTTTPTRTPTTTSKPRTQVAAASRSDTSAARSRAQELYRQKKFSEAAAVLTQAAASLSGGDASDLRTAASVYQQLGAAYNRGMAPAAKATDAYNDLRKALNLDGGTSGGELTPEIRARLAQVAPKAAMLFYIRKDYAQAFQAVRTAEGNGVTNNDTALVREKLEQAAKELYDQAAKEMSSNPTAAKQKLTQIKGMVDSKSPTLVKATQLLNSN